MVIGKPKNEFTLRSLLRASEISYNKKKDHAKATEYLKMLDEQAEDPKDRNYAITALMRSYYILKNYPEVINYANRVLKIENAAAELINEAHFDLGTAAMASGDNETALAEFRVTGNNSKAEIGAEAQYHVAEILYMKKDYKESKRVVMDLIGGDLDYPYWVTKAMIVLADNHLALNEVFQAKGTLKGIIEGSDIPELIKIAQEKLDKIAADEEAAKKQKTMGDPLKVGFEGDQSEQERLFKEMSPEGEQKKEGEPKHE